MAIARQQFHNKQYRSNQQSRKVNLLSNSPITIDTAATNRVTIQNGVRYSVGCEGIKGKLQTVQFQYEPESSSRQFSSRQLTTRTPQLKQSVK
jgi:hypothetical protein